MPKLKSYKTITDIRKIENRYFSTRSIIFS